MLALLLPVLLTAQSALLEIRLAEGGGAVYAAGTRVPGFAVEVLDELRKPVAGAVVSVRLPDDGPGGSFANGLSSEILTTGTNGRAVTSPIRWNAIAGAVEIRITAVKGQLRAGTVAACEISGAVRGKTGKVQRMPGPTVQKHSAMKWILIAGVVAAGAAGVGFATGRNSKSGAGANGDGPKPSTPIEIGPPAITIGKS